MKKSELFAWMLVGALAYGAWHQWSRANRWEALAQDAVHTVGLATVSLMECRLGTKLTTPPSP
jgi:hypothetical protein